MTELRKAAEMVLEAWEGINYRIERDLEYGHEWAVIERELGNEAIKALRQALAKEEQEPAKYKEECWACGCEECICAQSALGYFAPQKQEPVAWANADDLQNFDMRVRTNRDHYHTVPLYLAPPKAAEWVGLTREDKDDLVHALPDFYSMENVILATEAKLKEKNT